MALQPMKKAQNITGLWNQSPKPFKTGNMGVSSQEIALENVTEDEYDDKNHLLLLFDSLKIEFAQWDKICAKWYENYTI